MENKEDQCKGTFWESRYKSIAILDEEALLATCSYIDQNPVAAGLAASTLAGDDTYVCVDRLAVGKWSKPIVGCKDGRGDHFRGGPVTRSPVRRRNRLQRD